MVEQPELGWLVVESDSSFMVGQIKLAEHKCELLKIVDYITNWSTAILLKTAESTCKKFSKIKRKCVCLHTYKDMHI